MWLALAGAILIEVLATLSLRASDGFRKRIWIVPVVVGYATSFYLLWVSLSLGIPVGIAYGVWTAKNPGSYEVCFGPVAGYTTPACQSGVTVAAGATVTATGTYVPLP